MQVLGIALRKPSFNEITAATILGVGLWLCFAGLVRAAGHPLGAADAGAALVVSVWGCLGARLGIRIGMGSRHLLANLAVSAALLAVYEGIRHLVA